MPNPFAPQPAIVRTAAQDLGALTINIHAAHRASEASLSKGIEHAVAAGKNLLMAKACVYGSWLDWVEKNVTFSSRQARNYMLLAANEEKIKAAASLREALKMLVVEPEDKPEPAQQPVLCRACRIGGAKGNCKDCASLQAPQATPEREAGVEDDPEETKETGTAGGISPEPNLTGPAPGSPVFEYRKFQEVYGPCLRILDKFEKAYGCKDSPEVEVARELVKHFKTKFDAVYAKFAQQPTPED